MFTDINLNTVKFEDIISSGVDYEFLLGMVDDKKLKAYIEIKRYYVEGADWSKYQQYIFETNVERSPISDSSTIVLRLDKDDIYENISNLPFNTLEDDPVDATIYIIYNKCCIAKIRYQGTAVNVFTIFDGESDFIEVRIILDGYTIPLEKDNKQTDLASIFATPVLVFDKRKMHNITGVIDYGPNTITLNNDDNISFVPMTIPKLDSLYKGSFRYVATITYNNGTNKSESKIILRRKEMYTDYELELVIDTQEDTITLMDNFGLCNVYYNGKAYKRSLFTKEGFDNVYRSDKERD